MADPTSGVISGLLMGLGLATAVPLMFAPVALLVVPFITSGGAAFGCALVVIPISIKAMVWVEQADFWDIIRRLRGGN
jgi:hypothetical protein